VHYAIVFIDAKIIHWFLQFFFSYFVSCPSSYNLLSNLIFVHLFKLKWNFTYDIFLRIVEARYIRYICIVVNKARDIHRKWSSIQKADAQRPSARKASPCTDRIETNEISFPLVPSLNPSFLYSFFSIFPLRFSDRAP